jgi:hypothetical protein
LTGPESGDAFNGANAYIRLGWRSNHTLADDEYFEVRLEYVSGRTETILPVYVQQTHWFVDKALHLQADQETGREYSWSVRVVRKVAGVEGSDVLTPLGPSSQEWTFYWN